jgi:hypothetical protein
MNHLRVLTGSRGIDFDAIDNSCSTGSVFCKNKTDEKRYRRSNSGSRSSHSCIREEFISM